LEFKYILTGLRKCRGFSQEELASRVFVTRQAVSRWENGETIPKIDTLKRIADVFDVPISRLMGFEDDKLCLFRQSEFVFSYRVAGILVRDGNVLLQKPDNTEEYALPGGHVIFGETAKDALIRRWREELCAEITVGELKWVEENLFMWGDKPCQQISWDYIVKLKDTDENMISDGALSATYKEGDSAAVRFYWVALDAVRDISVYPSSAAELLKKLDEPLQHIVYYEDMK